MLYAVCMSGEGRRREEDEFLSFKSIMWVVTFSFTRERMREGKTTKAGRKVGREGVGGK